MAIVFFLQAIGIIFMVATLVAAFWFIPKYARHRAASLPGFIVVIAGIIFAFIYYPETAKTRNEEALSVYADHLSKSAGLRTYSVVDSVTGVIIEDSYNRGKYKPWNRPEPGCNTDSCNSMLEGEAEPENAIRTEAVELNRGTDKLTALIPDGYAGCRTTVYNRTTGEILARLFSYKRIERCSWLTDSDIEKLKTVLLPASRNITRPKKVSAATSSDRKY